MSFAAESMERLKLAHDRLHEVIRERDELQAKLAAMTIWLELNQPDVFRRGLWDAINSSAARMESGRG